MLLFFIEKKPETQINNLDQPLVEGRSYDFINLEQSSPFPISMLYLSENLLSTKPKFGEGRRGRMVIHLPTVFIRATHARVEMNGPILPAQVANQKTASSWAVVLKKLGKPPK